MWSKFKILSDHRAHYYPNNEGVLIKTLCGKWFNKAFLKNGEKDKCRECEKLSNA